jgi:hypothetical protein
MMEAMFEMLVFEVLEVWFGGSAVRWFGDVGGMQMRGGREM